MDSISLETHEGIKLTSQEDINNLYNEWSKTFTDRKNGKDAEHLVFSTSEPASKEVNEAILNAARETLKEKLGDKGFHYAFGIHNDTKNTHVHAIVRTYNPNTKKQLRILKEDIREIKKEWANNLQKEGLNYVVSLNIDKIKSMSDKLEYVKNSNYTWFETNINKLKEKNVDEIGNKLIETNNEIDKLKDIKNKKQQELQDIFYDKTKRIEKDNLRSEITELNKNINRKYAEVRSAVTLLNNLEYESQVANINYEKLKKNKDKITGILIKQSKSYKELEKNVNEAYNIMLEKKLQLDKAHIYLSKINSKKNYEIDITTNKEVSYAIENIKSLSTNYKRVKNDDFITNSTLKKIDELNKSIDGNTTYFNKSMINELNTIANNFKEKNVLPTYNQKIRKIIDKELKSSFNNINNQYKEKTLSQDDYSKKIQELAKLKQDIKKGFDIPLYKLKKFNIKTEIFETKEVTLKVRGINKLNEEEKNTLYEQFNKLSKNKDFKRKKLLEKIKKQIREQDSIYQSQANKLGLNINNLEKKLNRSFEEIDIKQEAVHTEKTYINWENNNYTHIVLDKNFDYKKELQNIEKQKELSQEQLRKLDIIKDKALENKDFNSFEKATNLDILDSNLAIKQYGEVLQVSPKKINQEIWTEIIGEDPKAYDLKFITSEFNQEIYNYNYKEEFINRYVDHLKNEYLLQKDLPTEEKEEQKYYEEIEKFEKLCNDFKKDFFETREKENLIKETKELLNDGNFLEANKNMNKLDKFEKLLYLDKEYEYAINQHSNNLDNIANKINQDSLIRDNAYLLDSDDSIYRNKENKEIKQQVIHEEIKEINEIKIEIKKTENTKKINYDELLKEQIEIKENFFNQIDKIIEKKERSEKDKLNKIKLSTTDKTINTAKSVTYALKSNLKEIKDTKKFIDSLEVKEHKKTLLSNLDEYKKISVELNKAANNFILNVINAKLSKEDKVKVLDQVFNTLDELNYTDEIRSLNKSSKELNQELIKRDISQFKHLNNKLEQTKDSKEINKITNKSNEIFNRLKGTDLTFTQQLKVRSLQNKQQKQVNKNQSRGREL
ncbi:hypothetical protein OZZ08_11905 [Malaciobacter mytili]|uniref:relaxase/mobilization nuclease domain-containing protein n=1 Tax=Malaciobacter mytili TaxID=603050 RepID=UPI003BB1961A